jgi:hypothetical protein
MFSAEDRAQLEGVGITVEEAERQLALFADPPSAPRLDRPCTVGDGIVALDDAQRAAALAAYAEAAAASRLSRFVPASGAATRMFQALLAVRDRDRLRRDDLAASADADAGAREVLQFFDRLERFAFVDALRAALARAGRDLDRLRADGEVAPILSALLDPDGLGYAALPKALLLFHRYPGGSRTAFEEHLIEGGVYARGAAGAARLHFTVSPEHEALAAAQLEEARARVEGRSRARLAVTFSTQKRATDTIAADGESRPFRDSEGRLVLRPGGHGALIENLADLGADVVFIKTVDNVQPDHLRAATAEWLRLLTGHLVVLQRELGARLERPLRVVGVVRNTGEPGGGPFWVRGSDGGCSLQIIESAQVDQREPGQREIFAASTHFNPVFMACGVRDHSGAPYDLRRFVDPSAVFIARKSKDGRALQALERPGLWNGAMAHWHTVFVEIPLETFTPVKTVNDLLRPAHQPPSGV